MSLEGENETEKLDYHFLHFFFCFLPLGLSSYTYILEQLGLTLVYALDIGLVMDWTSPKGLQLS